MNLLNKIILISYFLFVHCYSSSGQYRCSENIIQPDTLNYTSKEFILNFKLTDKLLIKKLELIAKKILDNQNCNFTVLISNKGNWEQKQNQWSSGYNLIMYFIDKYQIKNTQLIFRSDENLEQKSIIIRLPTKEENSGPNCGIPIMPKLRR